MKKNLLFLFCILSVIYKAQTYPSQNINLVSMIHPNTGTVGVGTDDRRYNGCWGWKQPVTNKEYAIVGTSIGTYFIDISTPSSPSVSAFVGGRPNCTWREIKTYQNYCYVVSDDGAPNTFQIIDMSQLPSTVTVVHNGGAYFERGHTIYIDGDKMYIGSVTYTTGHTPNYSSMDVYSLATPTAPTLLRRLSQDYPAITTVHDMFVKNDTVYASCGFQGLYIYKFNPSNSTFTQIGSYTNYTGSAYNHSSWITANSKYLVFCDEVPASLPIKLVDIQNINNIQPIQTFNPHPATTPHNPYIIGNNYAVVSCYQDGLNIYNIATPTTPFLAGYFDTHPQGGFNVGNYFNADYRGNWGAYPYLPSGLIIALDMQNGVFILDASAAFLSTNIKSHSKTPDQFMMYPNPANEKIAVTFATNNQSKIEIKNILGQTVFTQYYENSVNNYIETDEFPNGTYFVNLTENNNTITKKLIINH